MQAKCKLKQIEFQGLGSKTVVGQCDSGVIIFDEADKHHQKLFAMVC
jgi:hypothetical protein